MLCSFTDQLIDDGLMNDFTNRRALTYQQFPLLHELVGFVHLTYPDGYTREPDPMSREMFIMVLDAIMDVFTERDFLAMKQYLLDPVDEHTGESPMEITM